MSNTETSKSIKLMNPGPLDAWMGPYESVAAANAAIPNLVLEGKNLRVAKFPLIGTDDSYVIYCWQGGFANSNLTPLLKGTKGDKGDKAWQQVFANVDDGGRVVRKLIDYVGGEGTKPTDNINSYESSTGFTTVIADAKDIRGPQGNPGTANVDPWTARTYAHPSQATNTGKLWKTKMNASATDIPGLAPFVWEEVFTGYIPIKDLYKPYDPEGTHTPVPSSSFTWTSGYYSTTGAAITEPNWKKGTAIAILPNVKVVMTGAWLGITAGGKVMDENNNIIQHIHSPNPSTSDVDAIFTLSFITLPNARFFAPAYYSKLASAFTMEILTPSQAEILAATKTDLLAYTPLTTIAPLIKPAAAEGTIDTFSLNDFIWVNGYYVSSGNSVVNANWKRGGLVPIKPNARVVMTGAWVSTSNGSKVLDENLNVIQFITSPNAGITDADAVYSIQFITLPNARYIAPSYYSKLASNFTMVAYSASASELLVAKKADLIQQNIIKHSVFDLDLTAGTSSYLNANLPIGEYRFMYFAPTSLVDITKFLASTSTSTTEVQSFKAMGAVNLSQGFTETITISYQTQYLALKSSVTTHLKLYIFKVEQSYQSASIDFNKPASIYVSPLGNDSLMGFKSDQAVLTLDRAVEVMKMLPQSKIKIRLQQSIYRPSTMDIPVGKDVEFIPYGDVEIRGSKILSSWESTPDPIVYKINITYSKVLNCIYVNNEKRVSASSERLSLDKTFTGITVGTVSNITDGTYGKVQKITLEAADITSLAAGDYYKNVVVSVMHEWKTRRSVILAVDTVGNTITTKCLSYYLSPELTQAIEGDWYVFTGDKMVFENINFNLATGAKGKTSFDKGTFYTDGTGYLYYKLKDGETTSNITLEIPSTTVMCNVYGKAKFANLKVSQTLYDYMDGGYGAYPSLFMIDSQGGYTIDAAIKVYGSATFQNIKGYYTDQTVIKFMSTSKDSVVEYSNFEETGCVAVMIGEAKRYPQQLTNPNNIVVENNNIKRTGAVLNHSCAILQSFATNCKIQHNNIFDLFYSGISIGFNWNSSNPLSEAGNNYIGFNKIYNIGRSYAYNDAGGIYSAGVADGLLIENNLVYNVAGTLQLVFCIYTDEQSRGILIKNNILSSGVNSVMFNKAGGVTYYNNILYNPSTAAMRSEASIGKMNFYRNIIMLKTGVISDIDNVANLILKGNLYHKASGGVSIPTADVTGVLGNPNFANPDALDFTISNPINTNLIGFETIDMSKVGVLPK